MLKKEYQKIPGVDTLLEDEEIKTAIEKYGISVVKYSIRNVLRKIRNDISEGKAMSEIKNIKSDVFHQICQIKDFSLKSIINATGIVLHTNFGRAPLGQNILNEVMPIITNYSNLEFDLETGKRGSRNKHLSELLKYITGAENAIVVNNNAAGLSLTIKTIAEGKEVIVSRGELIEIGGSFRIPEIIEASGAKLVEVGTTNRTRLSDYQNAITENTSIILKVHKSNYYVEGFTEEVEINELSKLTKQNNLVLVYDLGSGLLNQSQNKIIHGEPDVKSGLTSGADLITFSCDKLIGGPQAGIVVGKDEIIIRLAKHPLMRAFRVGKITIALLKTILSKLAFSKEEKITIPVYEMLNQSDTELKNRADVLKAEFKNNEIETVIENSEVQCGGGTLPKNKYLSYAVTIPNINKDKQRLEKVYKDLMKLEKPIIGILKEGRLIFDIYTISEKDIPYIAKSVRDVIC